MKIIYQNLQNRCFTFIKSKIQKLGNLHNFLFIFSVQIIWWVFPSFNIKNLISVKICTRHENIYIMIYALWIIYASQLTSFWQRARPRYAYSRSRDHHIRPCRNGLRSTDCCCWFHSSVPLLSLDSSCDPRTRQTI